MTAPPVIALNCTFPAGTQTATDVRHALRQRFHDVVAADALSDAELVLTELVANSVAASCAGAQIDVSVRQLIGGLLVEVADTCGRPPRLRVASSWDEEGRGLHLVAELSQGWGWHPGAQGKTVWAVCPGAVAPNGERGNEGHTSRPA